jgi:hypothetical protein
MRNMAMPKAASKNAPDEAEPYTVEHCSITNYA